MTNHNEVPIWKQEAGWLAKIASRLANDGFSMGDYAALRRMNPQIPSSHAEIAAERLLAAAGAKPTGEADRQRWLLIIHCLALTRGQHSHRASTGSVLAQVQYSEERINRLLSSDFEVIANVLPRLARFLGAKGVVIDWFLAELAAQALAEDTPEKAGEKLAFLIREQRANLRALKDGAGLGAALFGRMVTSDPAANTDAAIHVAHALTVHKLERDLDYMTVVDDLKSQAEGDNSGSAGIFDMELTSGLYYGYVVVDIGLLVSNLAQDREIAAQVVEHLVHLIAQVSPGAKKGSTAPYAWAELMLIEAGTRQPRTLANAFRDPVDVRANGLLKKAVGQMNAHLASLDAAYGGDEVRCQLAINADAILSEIDQKNLDDLAQWTADVVRGSGEQLHE